MIRQEGVIVRLDRTGIPLLVARLVVGGLFVYMGIGKIADDPVHFLKLMRQYQALPTSWPVLLNMIAVVLPWIETVCGAALILGLAVRGAGLISAVMLAMFTPMILMRGLELYEKTGLAFCNVSFDCGCGAGVVFLCSKLAENVVLFLLALVALFSRSRRFCLEARLPLDPAASIVSNGPVAD
ncbi:MAG: DoxX family protein [bacterium]|nr:DoxX family protein [bacterium]